MGEIALGLTSIRKRDSSSTRRKLFSALVAEKRLVRAAYRAFQSRSLRPAVSLALLAYSLRRLFQIRFRLSGPEIRIYHYLNERRAVERVSSGTSGAIWYGSWPSPASLRFLSLGKARQWIRVSMRLLERNGFLIGARQAEFLLLYGFSARVFAAMEIRGRTFISASESNPEIIAVTLAARRSGNRTVFVNHNAVEREAGTFFHDEIRVPGVAFVEKIRANLARGLPGPRFVVAGTPAPRPVVRLPDFARVGRIGIVCSVIAKEGELRRAIESCLRAFPRAEVVVRPHPNRSIARLSRAELPEDPRVRLSSGPFVPVSIEGRSWDFAIVGNSSSHLELLAAGVPTIYLDLDGLDDDLFDFVSAGLVPGITGASLDPGDLAARMSSVYAQERWAGIYARYDAPTEWVSRPSPSISSSTLSPA
jgi:hypothetical protein